MDQGAGQHEYELLSKAYLDYKVSAQSPGSVNSKCQLASLTDKLQKEGIYGNNALQLLNKLREQIGWHSMHPEEFRLFYQFVFFICREQGKRNVQVPVAVAAWRGLLQGRFRLLDRWCSFITSSYKQLVVTEDTWTQLLEFSRTVLEDLSNYDPTAAWPVALDEFVEHIRRSAKKPTEPMDLSHAWPPSEHLLAAVSPRSGSKRRMPVGVAEVAEQLQQLPLGSVSPEHPQQQLAMAAPSDRPRAAGQHVVKRYRVAGPAPTADTAALGFRTPQQAAASQPECEPCDEMMQGTGQRTAGGLHPMVRGLSRAAACDGGRAPQGWGHPVEPQQSFAQHVQGPYNFGPGAEPGGSGGKPAGWGCQQQAFLNNMGGDVQHMQLGGAQMHSRPTGIVDAFRCNSVNAMMQATVTDTLFFT